MQYPYWVLYVGIPFSNDYDAFAVGVQLEEVLGQSDGSGAGFGMRDIDWSYKSEEDLKGAMLVANATITELGIAGVEISSDCYEHENDY